MYTKIIFGIAASDPVTAATDNTLSYLIGGIIAFLILGYLVYSLLHPEKF